MSESNERGAVEALASTCPMGCLGHGGRGTCPHCGDWHADDSSCCSQALARFLHNEGDGGIWEHFDRSTSETVARALLASPWLAEVVANAKAEAWDEGMWAAYAAERDGLDGSEVRNPYRADQQVIRQMADRRQKDVAGPQDEDPATGLPVGECNCAHYGSAAYCAVHTQADYDSASAWRDGTCICGQGPEPAELHAHDCPRWDGTWRPSPHDDDPEDETEATVPVVRGWRTHPDGSRSGIERWVQHADGDWLSLDTGNRTSGDIFMEVD